MHFCYSVEIQQHYNWGDSLKIQTKICLKVQRALNFIIINLGKISYCQRKKKMDELAGEPEKLFLLHLVDLFPDDIKMYLASRCLMNIK